MDNTTLIILLVALLVVVVAAGLYMYRSRKAGTVDTAAPVVEPRPRYGLGDRLKSVFRAGLDESTWDQLEEALLAADVGVEPTTRIVDHVRASKPESLEEARALLAEGLINQFIEGDRSLRTVGDPAVLLIVGVNGSGKTTSIAKLAAMLTREGKTVLLGAADTFRAAAGEQLETWADRVGVRVVTGQQGGDAASVAFDAVASARAREADVVVIDTAGRLHGKKNLMAELSKIHRVTSAEADVSEVLLVLDATSGQNGLAQVEQFAEAVPLTGIVLTKLDGTARGGIVVAVEDRLEVPVKLVGMGESLEDLEPFDPPEFVASLLEE